jgi:hypothetical protein
VAPVYHPRHWQRHFRSQFVPALNHLVDVLERRLLPTFKESDISNEAEAAADQVWDVLMSMPATGDEDPSDFVEAAQEAGLDHFLLVTGIRQGVINMFAAGLYHAFEQQLLYFHREELLPYGHQHDKTQLKVGKVMERLGARGIALTSFRSWALVEELRLLANAVKHAEGESAEQLRHIRPDLFEDPRLKQLGVDVSPPVNRPIYLPMIGDDIFVAVDDLLRYREALIEFWRELGDALGVA